LVFYFWKKIGAKFVANSFVLGCYMLQQLILLTFKLQMNPQMNELYTVDSGTASQTACLADFLWLKTNSIWNLFTLASLTGHWWLQSIVPFTLTRNFSIIIIRLKNNHNIMEVDCCWNIVICCVWWQWEKFLLLN
jgi:hypothetical protein